MKGLVLAGLALLMATGVYLVTQQKNMDASKLVYVMRALGDKGYYLCKIDLDRYEVVHQQRSDHYQHLALDRERGHLYLTKAMTPTDVAHQLDRYSVKEGRFLKGIRTTYYSPGEVGIDKQGNAIVVEGALALNQPMELRKYAPSGKVLGELFIDWAGASGKRFITVSDRYWLLIQNSCFPKKYGDISKRLKSKGESEAIIHKIDIETFTMHESKNLDDLVDVNFIDAFGYHQKNKQFYVTLNELGSGDKKWRDVDLYLIDYPSFTINKRIPLETGAYQALMANSHNRYFLSTYDGILVMDTNTHDIINRLPYNTHDMVQVAPNLVLISGYTYDAKKNKTGWLLFYDLDQDKEIKRIEGFFGPISKIYNDPAMPG